MPLRKSRWNSFEITQLSDES